MTQQFLLQNQIKGSPVWSGSSVPPDENDDRDAGFIIGSLYILRSDGLMYGCTDDSPGGAVWPLLSKGLDREYTGSTFTSLLEVESTLWMNNTAAVHINFQDLSGVPTFRPGETSTIVQKAATGNTISFLPATGITIKSAAGDSVGPTPTVTLKMIDLPGSVVTVLREDDTTYWVFGDVTT
jgi:hypothetical protein